MRPGARSGAATAGRAGGRRTIGLGAVTVTSGSSVACALAFSGEATSDNSAELPSSNKLVIWMRILTPNKLRNNAANRGRQPCRARRQASTSRPAMAEGANGKATANTGERVDLGGGRSAGSRTNVASLRQAQFVTG